MHPYKPTQQAGGAKAALSTLRSSHAANGAFYHEVILIFYNATMNRMHARFAGIQNATIALFLEEANKQLGPEARAFFSEVLFRRK